ncbi:peptidoglycan-binding protein [Anatilimnocola sp. NA78]|uniref:peptidoglycan-binding domain-containing protein n=1 Tax=Anatilimnocola sp. NA78 TaxID=3415683 RepID=UPI003CE51DA9
MIRTLRKGATCCHIDPRDLFQDVILPVGRLENRGKVPGNLAADTRTVQSLLNRIPASQGGTQGSGEFGLGLAVDGDCGPLTKSAIKQFQKLQFPSVSPDSIVDPAQRTIFRLNRLASQCLDDVLLHRARRSLRQVARFIDRALNELETVEMALRTGQHIKFLPAIRRTNFHFRIQRSPAPFHHLWFIRETFRTMLQVVALPPQAGVSAFGFLQITPLASLQAEHFAYAKPGGYKHLKGQTMTIENDVVDHALDLIYLTPRMLDLTDLGFVYVIMHELSHYVGGEEGAADHIDDRAYFHRERTKYDRLTPFEATRNGDCYSQFAFEVNTGKPFLPTEHSL